MKNSTFLIAAFLLLFSANSFSQTARVQVIHNSADAAAATVDIWLDNTLLIDNFDFRTASPFIDAPAGVPVTIGVAPGNSTMSSQSLAFFPLTLTSGETYVVVANGIVSPTGYTPMQAFDLDIYSMGREVASTAGNTDVLVVHGSTDAPTVDVVESTAGNIVDNASYGNFYGYLELPTADYILNIQDENNTTTVAAYQAPLATLGLADNALVVLASGFLNPANNSGGPAFGLFAALPAGGALIPLPTTSGLSVDEQKGNSFEIYPNPTADVLNIKGQNGAQIDVVVKDLMGKEVLNEKFVTDSINISKLNPGQYFVTISSENSVETTSIIKK
ncbi:MAG: DUF4397 domain-containing protein [Bacteroidota bacterium]